MEQWNEAKAEQIKELTSQGILPADWDRKRIMEDPEEEFDPLGWIPDLMGQVMSLCGPARIDQNRIDSVISSRCTAI